MPQVYNLSEDVERGAQWCTMYKDALLRTRGEKNTAAVHSRQVQSKQERDLEWKVVNKES